MTDVTDAEKKAVLGWLDAVIGDDNAYDWAREAARNARRLLARPRLPAEPTPEMVDAMHAAAPEAGRHWLREACRALHAELTRPKTRTVWVVIVKAGIADPVVSERTVFDEWSDATAALSLHVREGRCVTIHAREIPAD